MPLLQLPALIIDSFVRVTRRFFSCDDLPPKITRHLVRRRCHLSCVTSAPATSSLTGSMSRTLLRSQSTTCTSLSRPCSRRPMLSFSSQVRMPTQQRSSRLEVLRWLSCGLQMIHQEKAGSRFAACAEQASPWFSSNHTKG